MSDKLKLKWLLDLICDVCNVAWKVNNKDCCEGCSMEQEYDDLGWNNVENDKV